ncbi:nucleoside phosphorylase [Paenibacillus caui]|uniref:nucleoside phosphorylase n=1 Tax=Paenibacillus caui TaxID=2873927 RepID=UPI001CA7F337|nr:nucleoside phosphorylase [Paenibacillus caui]
MINKIGPFMIDGLPAFTRITPEQVGPYVIFVVKDPLHGCDKDVAEEVAEHFDTHTLVSDTGMAKTYTGTYKGARITVVSCGSGAPELEIILMDFMTHSNAHTFIRVGGSGAMQEHLSVGDLVIATGAVRDDGTSRSYVPGQFPAIADYELVAAMKKAAEDRGYRHHLGITRSCDSEYAGVGRPARNGYLLQQHEQEFEMWHRAGVLNVEREASILLTLTTLFGLRGGVVNAIGDNFVTGEKFVAGAGFEHAIMTALDGIALLDERLKLKA